jgi:hypothetical protein
MAATIHSVAIDFQFIVYANFAAAFALVISRIVGLGPRLSSCEGDEEATANHHTSCRQSDRSRWRRECQRSQAPRTAQCCRRGFAGSPSPLPRIARAAQVIPARLMSDRSSATCSIRPKIEVTMSLPCRFGGIHDHFAFLVANSRPTIPLRG